MATRMPEMYLKTEMAVRCSACITSVDVDEPGRLFENDADLWTHITMVHLRWTPFECTLCPMMCMPSETVLQHHYLQIHPGKLPRAIYTYEECKKMEARRIFSESLTSRPENGVNALNLSIAENRGSCISVSLDQQEPMDREREAEESFPDESFHFHSYQVNDTSAEEPPQTPEPDSTPTDQPASDTTSNKQNEPVKLQWDPKPATADVKMTVVLDSEEQKHDPNLQAVAMREKHAARRRSAVTCGLCHKLLPNAEKSRHIWRHHVSDRRYSCNECSYSAMLLAQISRHAELTHKHPPGIWWSDHSDKVVPVYKRQYHLAFGGVLSPFGLRSGAKMATRICQLCRVEPHRAYRVEHIWQHHMSVKRFSCGLCPHASASYRKMMKHANGRHNVVGKVCWTDNTSANQIEFRAKRQAAYGMGNDKSLSPFIANGHNQDSDTENETKQEDPEDEMKTDLHSYQFEEKVETNTNTITPVPERKSSKKRTTNFSGVQRRIWCNICKKIGPNQPHKGRHIWRHHVQAKRFRCMECEHATRLLDDMKLHLEYRHKKLPSSELWINRTQELASEYGRLFNKAYGWHCGTRQLTV